MLLLFIPENNGLYRTHFEQQPPGWEPPPAHETVATTGPAGSIFITDYPILHRRAASAVSCTRNALKYNYWRTTAPTSRDWGGGQPFDYAVRTQQRACTRKCGTKSSIFEKVSTLSTPQRACTRRLRCAAPRRSSQRTVAGPTSSRWLAGWAQDADWNSRYGGIMSSCVQVSQRFFWLCNREYPKHLGGQAWPLMFSRANSVDSPWGLGKATKAAVQAGYSPKL